jgi:hypothetical protein
LVLSGTLKEYILADVFQLLTQQKITGKLILNNGHSIGIVVFKNGLIVGAEKEDDKFTSKLSFYLIDVKKQTSEIIKGKIKSFENNLSQLTNEFISKGVMTKSEMKSLAESVIEDITCSLFQWKHGTYNFSSLRTVEQLMVCDVSFPVENIVMEAMRRVDEWNRMATVISEESIFRTEEQFSNEIDKNPDPLKSVEKYLFSKIDGITPVKVFFENTYLSQYKVYETLASLIQTHKISVLSAEDAKTIHESISTKTFNRAHPMFSIFISIFSTTAVILIILLLSQVFFKNILFQKKTLDANICRIEIPIKIAHLDEYKSYSYYRAQFGLQPFSADSLKKLNILSSNDYSLLNLDSKLHIKNHKNHKEK